jgi:hypothetical protein
LNCLSAILSGGLLRKIGPTIARFSLKLLTPYIARRLFFADSGKTSDLATVGSREQMLRNRGLLVGVVKCRIVRVRQGKRRRRDDFWPEVKGKNHPGSDF